MKAVAGAAAPGVPGCLPVLPAGGARGAGRFAWDPCDMPPMRTTVPSVRAAVAAGSFYPDDASELRRTMHEMLAAVEEAPAAVVGAMAPHAGYTYSGPCAAEVFARIRIPGTILIVGPNHFNRASQPAGASLWQAGAFATPLGDVPIDEAFATAVREACPLVAHDPVAHRDDHALEVELPFLIERAAPEWPSIVPLLLRWEDWPRCRELAEVLAETARGRPRGEVLLLASSDMTHFEPARDALRRDEAALDAIRNLDGKGLLRICHEQQISMCGRAAAAVVVEAARRMGARHADVVAHTHSGIASGDASSVVSYAGVVIR